MSDYGHDLLFGSFITPTNAAPERVVGLAQLSEQAGLDLATFQDHPYQPGFLDTWTLLSWVAARTERIRLAPNVANLPLRPPAVLARSVASLDLLSGGRVELGLGSGAFWDAIEAMGGRRLTPGQGVDALREAIGIIRALWDTTDRTRVDLPGEHWSAVGAKRGPAPAHPVGIWVGAYKPRMLRLTGELADGWLPSLSYLQSLQDLDDVNARIDDAAQAAGRAPTAVRRLLNVGGQLAPRPTGNLLSGPPQQWVEELAVLALEHGVSAFIVGGDDPTLLATVGQEIAPAVRELVAAERGTRGTAPVPAPAARA
ncbi:LLM class flavin-dependent oxidoreductase [Cellulomonas hominis]|uniref:LLM class flavin-dependent oxidoreductase n=1 Tax=Cellulomonas hominis TaxID=156981 RepID=UPI00144403C2|nr:LLM class flavin-dependent oxidoreductase [Cellulomonas hominis]